MALEIAQRLTAEFLRENVSALHADTPRVRLVSSSPKDVHHEREEYHHHKVVNLPSEVVRAEPEEHCDVTPLAEVHHDRHARQQHEPLGLEQKLESGDG